MRKLKLDLDALDVDSFEILRAGGERGTVQGRVTRAPTVDDPTCQGVHSCDGGYNCGATCGASCMECGTRSTNTACAMCMVD